MSPGKADSKPWRYSGELQPIGNQAQLLSNDVLAKWLLEDFPYRIQLAPIFPFLPIAGDALRYATTGPLAPAATIGQCTPIPEDTKQPNDPNRVHRLGVLATHFRVCYKAQDIFSSNANDRRRADGARRSGAAVSILNAVRARRRVGQPE